MTTKKIPIPSGIRQGDSLSPIFFNLIIDKIIKKVETAGEGIKLEKEKRKIICYARDAIIMSEDEDDLQRMLYKFETQHNYFDTEDRITHYLQGTQAKQVTCI
ncbi:hypothetical protein M0804_006981 [Polistes exclamans]|nr:hypothetical protein M0804_006981 [Polistes exclamans]